MHSKCPNIYFDIEIENSFVVGTCDTHNNNIFFLQQRWTALITPRIPNRDNTGKVLEDDMEEEKVNTHL